jgi:methyl-accepting chemotaxis protein
VVDNDKQVIAANSAFSQLSSRLNQSDHNQTFKFLFDAYDKSTQTIVADDDLHLKQQLVPLTLKGLESCSLYVFEQQSMQVLTEQAWQQLIAMGKESYAIFDSHGKLVMANLDAINVDTMYLDQGNSRLLGILQSTYENKNQVLCLSESDDVYFHVNQRKLDSNKKQLTVFLLHQQAQIASFKQFEMLSKVVRNTSTSVLITDKRGLVEYVNPGFEKLSGFTLAEVKGKKPGAFLQGEQTDKDTVKRISQKLKAKEPFYEEILNFDKSGVPYWIVLSVNPTYDEKGNHTGFVGVSSDVREIGRIRVQSKRAVYFSK